MMDWLAEIHLINSVLGLVHTLFAVAAMVFGTVVLAKPKGTSAHVKIGYAYVGSMVFMNLTALGIYNFGSLSLFHGFVVVSLLTLGLGIYPALKRTHNWYFKHYYFMSWSVVGLYCAFWAEVGTRLLNMQYFWWIVMAATMLTAAIGGFIIQYKAKSLKTS